MRLEDTSFAALKVLCTIHDLQSFSRAAAVLEKSQSSMSYTVDVLRKSFGDPLFVRSGTGVVPTNRCSDIVATARDLVHQFEQLGTPLEFDPAQSQGVVRISCNYYERLTILPGLIRRLRRDARRVRIEVIQATLEGADQLRQGACDLFISPVLIDSTEVYSRRLFHEDYVCVMSKDNPLAAADIDLATYAGAPQALVNYGGGWKSFFLRELEAAGVALNVAVTIPSPASLQDLLQGTDLISTVPRRIAASMGPDIQITESPLPSGFDIHLYWSARTHNTMMHRWVRSSLLKSVAENPITRVRGINED